MAGTIPLSMTQQFDEFGKPLSGGLLYIIQAGTVSTPQQPYQDAALTITRPNPIPLDAAGRVPQFFLADGSVKIRLDDKTGVTQLTSDNILVIGPSAGGGGGGASVDATTLWATGDLKTRYDISVIAGFVRANGLSIGSATSGATERANADCQALFNFLWNIDATLAVTPSRGATSAADWAANKQIALPDWRGCTLAGLDGMGNALAGRLTPNLNGFNAPVNNLGYISGAESYKLLSGECGIVGHQHAVFVRDTGHGHAMANIAYKTAGNAGIRLFTLDPPDGYAQLPADAAPLIKSASAAIVVSSASGGANDNLTTVVPAAHATNAHMNIQPTRLCTIYIKL